MLSLKMILRRKMWVRFKDHPSIQFYLRRHKLSWVYTCILQLRSLGKPRTALLNRRRNLSEISTMTKQSVSLITSHQTSSPGDLNSLFVIFVLWSSVIYLPPPHKKMCLLGGPPGPRRKSWTWKHLEFLVASWEAEDSGGVDAECWTPLSSERFQKLVVAECEGFPFC